MKKLENNQLVDCVAGWNSVDDILGATCSIIGFTGGFGATKIGAKLLLKAGLSITPGVGQVLFVAGLACDLFW